MHTHTQTDSIVRTRRDRNKKLQNMQFIKHDVFFLMDVIKSFNFFPWQQNSTLQPLLGIKPYTQITIQNYNQSITGFYQFDARLQFADAFDSSFLWLVNSELSVMMRCTFEFVIFSWQHPMQQCRILFETKIWMHLKVVKLWNFLLDLVGQFEFMLKSCRF